MKHARVAYDGRIHDVHARADAPEGMLKLAGGRIAADDIFCAHCGARQPMAGVGSSACIADLLVR